METDVDVFTSEKAKIYRQHIVNIEKQAEEEY